jgi:hypothetical protein
MSEDVADARWAAASREPVVDFVVIEGVVYVPMPTCDTCVHQHPSQDDPVCGKTSGWLHGDPPGCLTTIIRCATFGNGCRAHEPKEPV